MGFADKIKRLFNIDSSENMDDNGAEIASELYHDDPEDATPATAPDATPVPEVIDIDPQMRSRIFAGVLDIFNKSLPDFLQRSVDPEAQRAALMASLDASIADYLGAVEDNARRRAAARLQEAAEQARSESERMRSRVEAVETEKNRIREQQLSADRRRRALDDRVRDLEEQLAKSEAEGEQLRLENQSLLNKLKVADIQPGLVDELNAQIKSLKEQNGTEALDAANSRIADLEKGTEISKSMICQLETQLAEEGRSKNENAAARAKAEEDLAKAREDLARVNDELAKAREELAEAAGIARGVEQLQEQIDGVQDIIRKRDEKISRLRTANKRLKDTVADLEQRLATQRQVAPAGLFALDNDEKIDNIEDDFQCPEWFVGEPEPGMGRIKSELDDFGYQEPPKKPKPPENKAQLSLF